MTSFAPNTSFERSRWMLYAVLVIQLVITVLVAGGDEEKTAVALVGAVSFVAVLTKRPWYTESKIGQWIIFATLLVLTGCGLSLGILAWNVENAEGAITGKFWIWGAPLMAGVIAIADWTASIRATTPQSP